MNTRNYIGLVLVILGLSTPVFAQTTATNKQSLEETLMNYLDGGTYGDTTKLIAAFHPSATMKFVNNQTGKFTDVPIANYLKGAKENAGKKANRITRIVSYDLNGTAAQAKVESTYDTFKFIDYFNLLKIDGRWLIVSKIFFREELPK